MAILVGEPTYAEDVNVALYPPVGRLVAQSSQTLTDNTQTAIQFGSGSTDFDTDSFHSESVNNTRVTPTVAGYYEFVGAVFFTALTTPVSADVNIRLNGTTNLATAGRTQGATLAVSIRSSAMVAMDGSTDYIELVARQDSSGSNSTNVSVQFSSSLEWKFIRPLS
jgi:hypothetical protein